MMLLSSNHIKSETPMESMKQAKQEHQYNLAVQILLINHLILQKVQVTKDVVAPALDMLDLSEIDDLQMLKNLHYLAKKQLEKVVKGLPRLRRTVDSL